MGTGASLGMIEANKKLKRKAKVDVSSLSDEADQAPQVIPSVSERRRFLSSIEEMEEETEGPHPGHPKADPAIPGAALGLHHSHDGLARSVTLDSHEQ
mmetsp:Transcript_35615/g.57286  ORF Transcript_35615/g.57286 Transcript_35615/m.57286 type:complete len:98 (-) Transcript_35615:203-496(-)